MTAADTATTSDFFTKEVFIILPFRAVLLLVCLGKSVESPSSNGKGG
jgi:hypothetical protein